MASGDLCGTPGIAGTDHYRCAFSAGSPWTFDSFRNRSDQDTSGGDVFMYIKFESRNVAVFAMTGLVWLAILFGLTFSDYLSRSWLSRADDLSPHVSASSPQPKDVVRDSPGSRTLP